MSWGGKPSGEAATGFRRSPARIGRPALVLAGAAGLVVLSLASPSEAQSRKPTPTGAVQVTSNPSPVRAHSTPLIARNPRTGELVIAEVDVRGTRECAVHISVDDGRSWFGGGDIMLKPFTDCSVGAEYGPHTMPFFDRDGVLYVVTTANNPQDHFTKTREPTPTFPRVRSFIPRDVFLARSTDGGRSFSISRVYEAPRGNPHLAYNYAPVGAVDPGDPSKVYVGWAQGEWQSPEEPVKAVVAASRDGGRSFGRPFDVGARTGSEHPWLAVGRDGTVHAVHWSKGFGKPLADPPPPVPTARRDPNPIFHVRSRDAGRTWTRLEIDPGSQSYHRPPVVVADPTSDAVYVVWYGSRDPMNYAAVREGRDRTDIFVRASRDGGETWGPKRTVNDDAGSDANHVLPGASIAPNGRLDVAWYDFRHSPRPGNNPLRDTGLQDVYYSFSSNGGRTFGPNLRVNDRTIDRSLGVWSNNVNSAVAVGVASTDDTVYFAWQDTRNGNPQTQAEDVYFASLRLNGPAAVSAAGGGLPVWVIGSVAVALGMGVAMVLVWLVGGRPRHRPAVT